MIAEHRSELAHLLAEHYSLKGNKDFDDKTRNYYLPQYRSLEEALRKNGVWLEGYDETVGVIRDALNCSEDEAREYIKFYDEITHTK